MFHNSIHIPRGCVPSSLYHIIAANNYSNAVASQPSRTGIRWTSTRAEDTQEQDDFVGSGMGRGEEGSKNIVIYKTKRKLSAQK